MRSRETGTAFFCAESAVVTRLLVESGKSDTAGFGSAGRDPSTAHALRVCDFFEVAKNRCCKENSYDDKIVVNSKKSQTLRNDKSEKDGLGLHVAAKFFGKLFHLFEFFADVFGQKSLAQLLQVGVQRHTQC